MTSPGQGAVCLSLSEAFPDGSLFWFLFFSVLTEREGFYVMGFSQQLASEQTDSKLGFNEFLPALLHPQ